MNQTANMAQWRRRLKDILRSWYRLRRDVFRGDRHQILDEFHKLYYGPLGWPPAFWLGAEALKCPLDLWMYQEILFDRRPSLIIETGSAHGGSALFLASICQMIGYGRVLSIDIKPGANLPKHERIDWLHGDSVSGEILGKVAERRNAVDTAMVILDSNHTVDHVYAELKAYSPLVSVGDYLIVEDTNINGHPVYPDFGPGPWEAVQRFLREDGNDFRIDRSRERFLLSFNPGGYLVRRR